MSNGDVGLRLPLGGRPNPQRGFGWGSSPVQFIQRFDDLPGDCGGITQHVGVPEAQDLIALAPEPRVPHQIMRGLRAVGVMSAVKLDDELSLKTYEVGVVGANRMLAAEFPSMIALGAQMSPKRALSRRRILPQRPGAFIRQSSPPPETASAVSASPQGGGEARSGSWPS